MIERPAYDLTLFKVHFGLLTLKGYTKGERVLRFEAIVHNTKTLKTGRALEKFPEIVARLAGMAGRFCTMLDCVDTGFIPGGTLDELPLPSQIGAVRTGGIDLNKPRSRAALAAALALAIAPGGLPSPSFAAKVRAMTGQVGYTIRNAAYDLRKLRGKHLVGKPGRSRRYLISPAAARIISALLILREDVIAPPGQRRRPADPPHSPPLDRHRPALPGATPGDDGPVRRHRHRLRMKHRQRQHLVDRSFLKRLRSVRDFARKEWPLRGSPAHVGHRGNGPLRAPQHSDPA